MHETMYDDEYIKNHYTADYRKPKTYFNHKITKQIATYVIGM